MHNHRRISSYHIVWVMLLEGFFVFLATEAWSFFQQRPKASLIFYIKTISRYIKVSCRTTADCMSFSLTFYDDDIKKIKFLFKHTFNAMRMWEYLWFREEGFIRMFISAPLREWLLTKKIISWDKWRVKIAAIALKIINVRHQKMFST